MSSTSDISAKWQALKQGAQPLDLGAAQGPEQDAGYGGRVQVYANGRIYWHPHAGGAHEVHGGILACYLALGGPGVDAASGQRLLGFPCGDEARTADERFPTQGFESGALTWVRDQGAVYTPYAVTDSPSFLNRATITFHVQDDDKDAATLLHVFIKNRRSNSLTPEADADFIGNQLAWDESFGVGTTDGQNRSPYLARGINLAAGQTLANGNTCTFELALRPGRIALDEIELPVANVHILTDHDDRFRFDYTVRLYFQDGQQLSFSSNADGVTGVVLDQDNRNHSGFGSEHPTHRFDALAKPASDWVLKRVQLEFKTHHDDKDADTQVNVHIVNRLSASQVSDIALGTGLGARLQWPDGDNAPLQTVVWSLRPQNEPGRNALALPAQPVRLADMVLPVVNINMVPAGSDQWIFDYRLTLAFGDPRDQTATEKRQVYVSTTSGVVLDAARHKHRGLYQGRPFPRVAPPVPAPLLDTLATDAQRLRTKTISLDFLRRKLDEFINLRNGRDIDHNPPLMRLRLHHSGRYGDVVLPESYVDVQSIEAGQGAVHHGHAPRSLSQKQGFLDSWHLDIGSMYFNDVNSSSLNLHIEPGATWPLVLKLSFECDNDRGQETLSNSGGFGAMDMSAFDITLRLSAKVRAHTDPRTGAPISTVDLMSWLDEEDIPDEVIDVHIQAGLTEPGDTAQGHIRDGIVSMLNTPDTYTGLSPRDSINGQFTSWLLGGVADEPHNTDQNNVWLQSLRFVGTDHIELSYLAPRKRFALTPPADWPQPGKALNTWGFGPGPLSNIHHIVVLTMENRSFDHMLGYLSLPVAQGGMGRTDVDGLKGGEANAWRGKTYPSFALTGTRFAPDPEHGHEPVTLAINGGKMDGFVQSHGEAHGPVLAGQIMGHHTGLTVPTYDALARDFSLGHRWFASHPGPTFCNRFYELTGRLNIGADGFWEFDNASPIRPQFTPTVFDHLASYPQRVPGAKPISAKYYEHGYCFLRFFQNYTFDDQVVVAADDPQRGFFADARRGTLPQVSFIDPHYIELPPDANCDGPPADVKDGQAFVNRVVEAVVTSPQWANTLLIVLYDEHGGFYDHVPPPAAVKVSPELPIATTGVRVPAFVVSPWVKPGTVFGSDAQSFDHTSVLKTIARCFMGDAPPYMGARYAAAQDLSSVISATPHLPRWRPFIGYTLTHQATGLCLDVRGGATEPCAQVWAYRPNQSVAQKFSFEDAGGDVFYIRSHCGQHYLTVGQNVPTTSLPPGGVPAAAVSPVMQDRKYAAVRRPGGGASPFDKGPAQQRWTLQPLSAAPGETRQLIACEACPGQVLVATVSSAGGAGAQATLALVPKGSTPQALAAQAWAVTHPLL